MTTTFIHPRTPSRLGEDVRAVREIPPPELRRRIRKTARLSLARLGRDIGVTSSAVWQWERTATPLPVTDNTVRYARLLAELHGMAEAA